MFDSISDLAVGTTGTAAYLLLWNWILRINKADPDADTEAVSRAQWRTRIWQIIFFLLMTPYVLLLFYVMEAVR